MEKISQLYSRFNSRNISVILKKLKTYQFIIYKLHLKEAVWCMSSNGNSRQNVYNPRRALIKLKEWEFENDF